MENTGKHTDGGLYRLLVPPLIIGLIALFLVCMAKPCRADAAVAIVDHNSGYTNKRAAIYTEGYDYYFIIESTPEQGRKLVMSTAPFVATCDGERDGSGAYTVELSSPGGDVFVRHFAHSQFNAYDSKYENCGSGAVLRFKYSGQSYETNSSFSTSNGIAFNQSPNRVSGVMYSMLAYLKAQDILFERYPYYVLGYNSSTDDYVLYLAEYDHAKVSDSYNWAGCHFASGTNKIYGFETGHGRLSFTNIFDSVSKSNRHSSILFISSNRWGCLYSNMTDILDGAGNYYYTFKNPYPGYDAFAGRPSPTPTPKPTPTPSTFTEYSGTIGALRNIRVEQVLGNMWMVKYDLMHDGIPLYKGVTCDDVFMTARIVLPSRSYVKEHFMAAADRSELLTGEAVTDWRINAGADTRTSVVYENVYEDALAGFTLGEDLRKAILGNWTEIYGDAVPKGYIDEVMAYAYPGVLAVRIQEKAGSTHTYIGPLSLTYPVKLYLSFEEYGKELSLLGGYSETLLSESTAGMTLTQMQDRAGEKLDKEIEDTEKEIEDSKKLVEELKKQVAALNVEIAELRASGTMDFGNIFSLFGSLVDGFKSSVAAFRGVASAVGSVFAFLPTEIIAIIGLTFVSLLLIAVYHALRG